MIDIILRYDLTWMYENKKKTCSSLGDIFTVDVTMNIGDISDGNFREKRRNVYLTFSVLYGDYSGFVIDAEKNLSEIKNRLQAGEQARLWYLEGHAKDLCNFYWLMSLFKSWEIKSKQLQYVEIPNYTYFYDNLRKVITKLIPTAVQITEKYMEYCVRIWDNLKKQNSYFRILINGELASESEDFYDRLLIDEIEKSGNTFKGLDVILNVMDKGYFNASDWLMVRMIKFEEDGYIRAVHVEENSFASRPYRCVYEKVKGRRK